MTEIYRVENKKGKGCYRNLSDGIRNALERLMPLNEQFFESDKCHPLPCNDYGINRSQYDNEICGFETLRDATNWFTEIELKVLRRLGYELKKITVQKITAVGYHQVLAVRG